MTANRSHTRLNRTILILLGILLACLLTVNASPIQSADLFKQTHNADFEPASSKTYLDQIGKIQFEKISKKISSLK